MSEYKPEKLGPAPKSGRWPSSRTAALRALKIGYSILFPIEDYLSIGGTIGSLKRREGKVYTQRKVKEGNATAVRVWRIK